MADRVDTLEDRENEATKARKRCEEEISDQRQTIQGLEMDIRKVGEWTSSIFHTSALPLYS